MLRCKTYKVLSLMPSSLAVLRCQTYNVMSYRAKCGVLLQYPMLRGETNYVLGLMPSSFPSPLVELCDKYHVLRSMPSSFAVPDAEFSLQCLMPKSSSSPQRCRGFRGAHVTCDLALLLTWRIYCDLAQSLTWRTILYAPV